MTEKLYTEAEILERTAAAMAAQRLADTQRLKDMAADWPTTHPAGLTHSALEEAAYVIRNAPLASAPEQKWLEEHDAEIIMREHANHSEFASDLYCILIDPLAEGSMKEAELFAAVKKAAIDQRQALHDWPEKLTRQLAVARAETYRHCAAQLPYDHWARTAFEKQAAEAEAQAHEGKKE